MSTLSSSHSPTLESPRFSLSSDTSHDHPLDRLWERDRKKLRAAALAFTGDRDEADDVMSETYLAFREGDRTWSEEGLVPFFVVARAALRSIVSNRRTKTRAEPFDTDVSADDFAAMSSKRSPESLATAKELHELFSNAWSLIPQRLVDEPLTTAVIALMERGITEAAEQAAQLKVTASEIYKARRRVTVIVEETIARVVAGRSG